MNDTGKCDVLVVSQDSARAEIVGMCVKSIMDEQVDMDVDLEVDNPNPEALHLVDIEFLVEDLAVSSEDHPVIVKQVQHSCAIQPRTSEVIKVPLQFAYKNDHLGEHGGLEPGTVVPYSVKLEYWFKENFHGMYKVSAEKTGELPVPARSTAKIQAASFNFDELGRPIAKVCMKLENRNTFSIKVTKLKCEIIRNSDGICAATAEDAFVETDRAMEVEAGGNGSIWMVASTGTSEETFGSALWDVFAGDYSRFTVLATVESETKFGKMVS
ncbi:hypothetical protein SELMODRAFT_98697 [Selaginella moellendorffii]|uniref:Uncharacterized protein n=1 Tax=Selaginella moellendorffii TaxID=88036 RepID=D8RNL0_SELML|nr:hypothetical protein SELMODRAFT_98697 [Selaginella moellendorffii]